MAETVGENCPFAKQECSRKDCALLLEDDIKWLQEIYGLTMEKAAKIASLNAQLLAPFCSHKEVSSAD